MQRAAIYFSRARLFGETDDCRPRTRSGGKMELPRGDDQRYLRFLFLKDLQDAVVQPTISTKSSRNWYADSGAAYAQMAEVALTALPTIADRDRDEVLSRCKRKPAKTFSLSGQV